MNRKLRTAKSAQQIKDEQIGLMLEEMEQDIENLKKTISEKKKKKISSCNIKKHSKCC